MHRMHTVRFQEEQFQLDLKRRFATHLDEFITIRQAACVLGRSETDVQQEIEAGKIEGVTMGSFLWVWKPSLENILRAAGPRGQE